MWLFHDGNDGKGWISVQRAALVSELSARIDIDSKGQQFLYMLYITFTGRLPDALAAGYQ
jgi:hypothetical protein